MTEAHLGDCMEAMSQMKDNEFDLAIVDPPYGWGVQISGRNESGNTDWNVAPTQEYFNELFRVSNNQIIWGGNYFELPKHKHFIVWDKKQPIDGFARCEFAWSSLELNADIFEYAYYGNINREPGRFHPTQKPVALYKWLLKNYAKEGDKILDTHLGSGSSRIAAHDMGFDFTGYEIDPDYFKDGEKRFQTHIQQQSMFKPKEMYT